MNDTKVQWHPGFVAAMNLELSQNRADLVFEKEYNLNTKPLEIDLLVVKKNASVRISNEIGKLFRGHNIMEYKSPEDHLDIDDFYKTGAYASLYKSYGKTVDEIKADDITVSIMRETRPDGLFRYFEEHGYLLSNPYKGIYYIEGKVLFPTQIVITKELEQESHIWLKALSEKLGKDDIRNLLDGVNRLTEKMDKEFADSVLEVSIGANKQVVKELMGDDSVCQALMEIMEPVIQEKVKKEVKKGGIQMAIDTLREFRHGDAEIKEVIMRKYNISEEEVERYL
ncbi:MAG: hypothetical protein NC314_11410 [Roseburia sp.]|nr:hypothetical protein [Ruminococcus sp.]MCM1243439.1 hypothetical protein [Roseburia sp.]